MLRKSILSLLVCTALSVPMMARATTLVDSITQAITSHPQVKASEASRDQAGKNIWEQRAAFFPTLSLDGQAGRLHNNDDTTRGNTPSQGAASSWEGQGTITLTQPLFSGFSSVNRVLGAESRFLAASDDLQGTQGDVALRAARAHMNMMRTREMLGLATQLLANVESRQKNIALMVKEGAADAAELFQADEIHAVATNTKLGYEESFRQAEADYIEVVGAPPDTSLEFGPETWSKLVPASVDEALSISDKENPHIRSADGFIDAMTKGWFAPSKNGALRRSVFS